MFYRNRVVKVFGVVWVDGKSKNIAAILTAYGVLFANVVGNGLGLLLNGRGELRVEVVFKQNGFELGIGFVRAAEYFANFAFWIEVALLPFE